MSITKPRPTTGAVFCIQWAYLRICLTHLDKVTFMRRIFLILFGLILCAVRLREVSRSQTWQIMGDLIHHGDRSQKVIALTFDDGPTAKFTGEILEILDHHQTPATFS